MTTIAASPSYPISTPVEFTITSGGDGLLFNAEGFSTGDGPAGENLIVDFVTTFPSDLLYRQSLGTANTLERLAVGAPGEVLTVGGSTAAAQIVDITTVAMAAVPVSSYFLLNSPSTGYYIWYDTTGTDVDPGNPATGNPNADLFIPAGSAHGRTGVRVDISGDTTAIDVATTSVGVIAALSDFLATNVGGTSAVMTITCDAGFEGIADAPVDGTTATTFAPFTVTTPGVSPTIGWASPAPGMASETFMAINSAAAASSVAAGATWVTLSNTTDTNVVWSTAVFGGHDAGALFTVATGIFLVPNAGTQIWQLSAVVEFEGNNSGNGGGGIPGRRAVRQIRIFNTTTAGSLAEGESQANGSNDNNTQIVTASACVSVTGGDSIVLQVRHDANVALDMEFEDETSVAAPVMYFTAHRFA
jgi:hypothetical protein